MKINKSERALGPSRGGCGVSLGSLRELVEVWGSRSGSWREEYGNTASLHGDAEAREGSAESSVRSVSSSENRRNVGSCVKRR